MAGPDGKLRCPWGLSAPEYVAYHDDEWGRPVRGDQAIFERLCLEAFQSGLSWLTILRKRENFRKAFAGFDIAAVAAFSDDDVARLLADAGIVRNRAKINAAITNARAALELKEALSDLVWSYADPRPRPAPRTLADIPAQTHGSKALAKELRKRGFVFTGPVTVYAAMQACGLVNDHLEACFARHQAIRDKSDHVLVFAASCALSGLGASRPCNNTRHGSCGTRYRRAFRAVAAGAGLRCRPERGTAGPLPRQAADRR